MSSHERKKLDQFMEEERALEELALKKRLKAYARRFGRKASTVDLDEVIDRTLDAVREGRRPQPPNVQRFTFLCNVLRSVLDHEWKRMRRLKSIDDEATPPLLAEDVVEHTDFLLLYAKMRELVSDDALLVDILHLWFLDSKYKPQEIAFILDIPIEEMRNAQRRLRARVSKLWEAKHHD